MRRPRPEDPVLDLWRATVSNVARQSGQDDEPPCSGPKGTAATYQHCGDVLTIRRGFAQRWAPDSPQTRYIIAHEFKHRAGESTTTELLRAAIC